MIQKAFAHLETWRPYTACYVGLVGLAGATLSGGHTTAPRLVAAWAVPTVAWIGALYGGDYFDRDLDAIGKQHRPIPSGRMAPRTALVCLAACVLAGGTVAMLLNPATGLLVVLGLALAISYNAYFKARGLAGHLARGTLTAFAFIFGQMMTSALPVLPLVPADFLFWLHDSGTNLVGAIRDVDADREGGYQTFPVRHGFVRSLQMAAVLYAGWMVLAAVTPSVAPATAVAGYGILAGLAALGGGAALVMLARAARPVSRRVALRAHEILVVERVLLAGAFVVSGLVLWVSLPVLAAALTVTIASQLTLRRRHEFGGRSLVVAGPAEGGLATPAAGATEPAVVLGYIDRQLSDLAGEPPLAGLRGWNRIIDISLSDLPLRIRLVAQSGSLRRVAVDGTAADGEPDNAAAATAAAQVKLTTTSAVFRDTFLLARSNPRRELLARRIRVQADARDLLHLNLLFNEFRRRQPPPAALTVSTPEPAGAESGEAAPALPSSLVISDTTLRDGEQAPGVAFSPAAKLQLAKRLAGMGIPLVEVGFPAVSTEEAEAVRAIVAADPGTVIQVIARPVRQDIDLAIESGAHSIAIFVGTSPMHLERKLRISDRQLLRQVYESVSYAKKSGRHIVFVAEDATRTDPSFLACVFATAAGSGADALGLADTVGIATPWSITNLIRALAPDLTVPLAVHLHNDLGLATANSVAALLAGASGVQCSVLGIGERAGNASLEEVLLTLEIAYGFRTGIDLTGLTDLAQEVASLTGQQVMPGKPIVGRNAFLHESGLHTSGIVHDPSTYEPYPPEVTGRSRTFAAGKHSGRSGLRLILARHRIELPESQLDALLGAVKGLDYHGDPLGECELVRMAEEVAGRVC